MSEAPFSPRAARRVESSRTLSISDAFLTPRRRSPMASRPVEDEKTAGRPGSKATLAGTSNQRVSICMFNSRCLACPHPPPHPPPSPPSSVLFSALLLSGAIKKAG